MAEEETTENIEQEEQTPLTLFYDAFAELAKDVSKCIAVFEDDQMTDEKEIRFWSRMLARSVFALIEGTTYSMTYLAYRYPTFKEIDISPSELEEIQNAYDFDDFKDPNVDVNKEQMLNRIQLAFNLLSRVNNGPGYPLAEKTEWVLIKGIYRIKRHLMTPRDKQELTVYEENRETLIEGSTWFIEQVTELLTLSVLTMAEYQLKNDPTM